jgi:hypothetical protein
LFFLARLDVSISAALFVGARIRRATRLALVVFHVAISGRGTSELRTASRTDAFGGGTGLLALVSEQVAESRELAAIATVLPALRLRAGVENTNVTTLLGDGTTRTAVGRVLSGHQSARNHRTGVSSAAGEVGSVVATRVLAIHAALVVAHIVAAAAILGLGTDDWLVALVCLRSRVLTKERWCCRQAVCRMARAASGEWRTRRWGRKRCAWAQAACSEARETNGQNQSTLGFRASRPGAAHTGCGTPGGLGTTASEAAHSFFAERRGSGSNQAYAETKCKFASTNVAARSMRGVAAAAGAAGAPESGSCSSSRALDRSASCRGRTVQKHRIESAL